MIYLITRHPGALHWLRKQFDAPVTHLTHMENLNIFHVGDCVVGNLPVDKVAQLNRRGVRYLHLCIELPEHLRGKELSAEQLYALNASLGEFFVTEASGSMTIPKRW
jgi:CRISPR-associated protein Csx16